MFAEQKDPSRMGLQLKVLTGNQAESCSKEKPTEGPDSKAPKYPEREKGAQPRDVSTPSTKWQQADQKMHQLAGPQTP
eukprot:1146357-Pelagomonas_calceolata.AAC.2